MGLLDDARGWLATQMQAAAGRELGENSEGQILYLRRDGGEPVDLTGLAWVGRTVFTQRAPVDRGPSVVFGDRDYLIPVSALTAEPVQGDRVQEVMNGVRVTFEVLPTLGEPAWRYSDPLRTVYRVHVKEVASETVG